MPSLLKTWQISPNNLSGTSRAGKLLAIKNTFKSFAQNPWIVAGSGNGVTGAMDGTDRWSTISDIVFSTAISTTHSWMCLQNAGGWQFLIDYYDTGNDDTAARFTISPRALFTGGSGTTAPTATDQIPEAGAPSLLWSQHPQHRYWGPPAFVGAMRYHVWHSTDGRCTYVRGFEQATGAPYTYWAIGEPVNPPSQWAKPIAFLIGDGPGQSNITGRVVSDGVGKFIAGEASAGKYQVLNGQTELAYVSGSWGVLGVQQSFKNEISNEWQPSPFVLFSQTPGFVSPMGIWPPDVYSAAQDQTGFSIGDFMPGSGTKLWVKDTGAVFPWDGVSTYQFNT